MKHLKSFLSKYFYLCMAILTTIIVIYGFSNTIGANLLNATPRRPGLLGFHGAIFYLWMLFFILQSTLVRVRKVSVHKFIGWFGVALGMTMFILGLVTAVVMANFHMQFPKPHAPSADAFLAIPITNILCFGVIFVLAVVYRGRPEWHRRFMLLATIVLTNAAFGRFPASLVSQTGALAVWWVNGLIVLAMLRDLIVQKRIHPIYFWTLPILIAVQQYAGFCVGTNNPSWLHVAHFLMGL